MPRIMRKIIEGGISGVYEGAAMFTMIRLECGHADKVSNPKGFPIPAQQGEPRRCRQCEIEAKNQTSR